MLYMINKLTQEQINYLWDLHELYLNQVKDNSINENIKLSTTQFLKFIINKLK